MPMRRASALHALVASICMAGTMPCSAQNLVVNGDFEAPSVPVASPQLYRDGADVEGWTVIGERGNVALLNGGFSQLGLTFTPQQGKQSLDLTGLTNTATGITQSVPTVSGARYDLSFHVGNVQAPDKAPWGKVSSVLVLVNGSPFDAATHDGGPTGELGWRKFTYPFTATGASTRIAFINRDSPNDHVNQLDNVSVVAATSQQDVPIHRGDITPSRPTASDRFTPWVLITALSLAVVTVLYLHALMRLYGIIRVERPDWVPRGAASGIVAVHRAAFGSQVHQLSSMGVSYARRLRVLLLLGIVLLAVATLWALRGS